MPWKECSVMDERLQLNHRPLGYGAVNTFVDLAQLNPVWAEKNTSNWTQLWTQEKHRG